jgi:hypothetical protein
MGAVPQLVSATVDETEAFQRRRRETLRPGSHVMKGATSAPPPPTYGSLGKLPFFIATWITDPVFPWGKWKAVPKMDSRFLYLNR